MLCPQNSTLSGMGNEVTASIAKILLQNERKSKNEKTEFKRIFFIEEIN